MGRSGTHFTVRLLNGALRAVRYEALVKDPSTEFARVFSAEEAATLGALTLVETPKIESLSKYRDVLSDEQVAEIDALERHMSAPSAKGESA
ncbi:hypothetical protein Q4555_15445 [Octadecabacter sp. 1_MG-2023]|uniref:hypothetical protein n=1 Tax=unclassified Octadecabacter TaxID=196158 RepID=UPI001C09001B|nr:MULTISPECIES: hypothetical protein [unclassified Octadecabacter]MBU2994073.1 hypothetical protein [Octadecabacter sp. B2R22]MDO6736074.1 hypothetical protein [Octadecabacter sp. 1_MG-2023]